MNATATRPNLCQARLKLQIGRTKSIVVACELGKDHPGDHIAAGRAWAPGKPVRRTS